MGMFSVHNSSNGHKLCSSIAASWMPIPFNCLELFIVVPPYRYTEQSFKWFLQSNNPNYEFIPASNRLESSSIPVTGSKAKHATQENTPHTATYGTEPQVPSERFAGALFCDPNPIGQHKWQNADAKRAIDDALSLLQIANPPPSHRRRR